MASQLLVPICGDASSCSPIDTWPEKRRHTAGFHPTVWGSYFLKYASETTKVDDTTEEQIQKLKEEVKSMLAATSTTPTKLSQALELVDTIQRLGLSYHSEEVISEILTQIKNICVDELIQSDDLHIVSLWFRLLRQEGYDISSEIFKKFTTKDGKFKDELTSDVQGMLSLYEASHLMTHGESILEEALSFTTLHLQSSVATTSNLSSFLVAQVKHALERPIRKDMPRIAAKHFISIYHEDPSHSEVLLNFAKIDFNNVQKLHQKELGELTRWWKELDFESKLPYFRDRLAESYFWMMGIYFEPKYALGRNMLAKVLSILVVIDDTYDAFGTIEELQTFTNAIHRWNINCLDQLPVYMKSIYKSLLDIYEEIEELMEKEGRGSYRIHYAKDAMKDICQSYFKEAEWFSKNYTPTMEEHFEHALVTGGMRLFAITSFLGMGDIVTEEAFERTSKCSKIVCAGSLITRLMGDIVSHKFERKRGHVASSIEVYVNHYGASEEEAYTEFRKKISDAWKDINEEMTEPCAVPMRLLTSTINFARVVDIVYKYADNFTHAGGLMKDLIQSMFVDPVPM